MTFSSFDLLKQLEGREPAAYLDAAQKWTIGYGHKLTDEELKSGWLTIGTGKVRWMSIILTEEQMEQLAIQDLAPRAQAISENVRVPINQHQFDALVIFIFNVGVGAFKACTALRMLNAEKYSVVPDYMKQYNKARVNGKLVVNQGLINRRAAEAKLWNTPV